MGTMTKQALFSRAVLAYMSEVKGGNLKRFCEVMTQAGGETITFNRIKPASGNGTLVSMYSGDTANDVGNMEEVKATIGYIGEQQKVKDEDMKKTTVDIKNVYVKSLSNGVARKEDDAIIDAIVAKTPTSGTSGGTKPDKVTITDYSSNASVKLIIKEIRKAQALAGVTPDNHRGVALVMCAKDWAELATSDYALNNDFAVVYGGGKTGEADRFFGAEVVLVTERQNKVGGTERFSYVIPSNTVCFGEWENSVRADAEFHPTDKMQWHLQVVKSVGVAIAEPASITQLHTA